MHTLPPSEDFPFLNQDNHRVTSPQTRDYNCIGWAAGEDDRFWWPNQHPFYYWPIAPKPESSVQAFIEAFATLGYSPCDDGELDANVEKVALYVDKMAMPTHMARQLENGEWTSKLGSSFDIVHCTPDVINGPAYGSVHLFLSRLRTKNKNLAPESHVVTSESFTTFMGMKVGRNDPCPCDSGKKFKHCHGKLA